MDEDEGHTNNDDLRMMGLEGDDEDGLEDDRLALFGPRHDNVEVIMPIPPPCAAGGAVRKWRLDKHRDDARRRQCQPYGHTDWD
ncbi:hypothetical protein C2845_PM15G06800 [Panicum miliaceum]|uniref:Uncharacterized protein n=1 Tax=Panicum miliaceum TaxID=4540 RepID=A0A3L6QC74_PANMI|nr:hypothetical protein C2845_PM15G06800 [Panicum miliaceum]